MIEVLAPYSVFWLKGAAVTLGLAAASFPVSLVLGLLLAFASRSSHRLASRMSMAIMNLFRGLPEILVLFIVFYGSSMLIDRIGEGAGLSLPKPDPVVAAIVALSVQFGTYAGIIFRDWMGVMPKGLAEAGTAIGMTPLQIRRRIVVPFVLRSSIPALGNLFMVMLKISALASLIGVEELSRTTGIISGSVREPLICYMVAAVLYLVISAIAVLVQHRLERRGMQAS